MKTRGGVFRKFTATRISTDQRVGSDTTVGYNPPVILIVSQRNPNNYYSNIGVKARSKSKRDAVTTKYRSQTSPYNPTVTPLELPKQPRVTQTRHYTQRITQKISQRYVEGEEYQKTDFSSRSERGKENPLL
ncbi:UNVERIFIED_CONTAM: hypothetical protein Sindi_0174700 [Sesamum indicum]